MKYREFAAKLAIFTMFLFHGNVRAQISEKAQQFYENGEFNKARNEIKRQLPNNPKLVPGDTEIFLETMNRIEIDFRKSEEQILVELKAYFPNVHPEQLRKWENKKKLEMRVIDGERRYFRNAVPNLFRLDSAVKEVREFYITGIDAYRLIVNDDLGREFKPSKKFYRSEPIDFQRGEMEWDGGNLYFDKWDYNMKITNLNKK